MLFRNMDIQRSYNFFCEWWLELEPVYVVGPNWKYRYRATSIHDHLLAFSKTMYKSGPKSMINALFRALA